MSSLMMNNIQKRKGGLIMSRVETKQCCPNCNTEIKFNKERQIKCICGVDLMLVKVNNKELVLDVILKEVL